MKKILFLSVIFFCLCPVLKASNNKLVFQLDDKEHALVYDTDQFDKKSFLHHTDMVPGVLFEDSLKVVNSTKDEYLLYMKIKPSTMSEKQRVLLENIVISLYDGDELIYTGSGLGANYEKDNQTFEEVIPLGVIDKDEVKDLKFVSYLKNEFDDITNDAISQIEWDFYAYTDTYNGMINPNTKDNVSRYAIVSIISFICTLIMLYVYVRKEKENMK